MKKIAIRLTLVTCVFLLPYRSLAQPCPPSPCSNCDLECVDPCSIECIDCVTKPVSEGGCQGMDIPISDHAGFLFASGLFMISFYFIRRGKKLVLD